MIEWRTVRVDQFSLKKMHRSVLDDPGLSYIDTNRQFTCLCALIYPICSPAPLNRVIKVYRQERVRRLPYIIHHNWGLLLVR